jgi:hypothetical protein
MGAKKDELSQILLVARPDVEARALEAGARIIGLDIETRRIRASIRESAVIPSTEDVNHG